MQAGEFTVNVSQNALDLGELLNGLDLHDADDRQIAQRAALKTYGRGLCSITAVPTASHEYLQTIERQVLLEARAMLRDSRLRVFDDDPLQSWRSKPLCDKDAAKLKIEAGALAGCMVISAELEDGKPVITLQRASYSMEHESYTYVLICDAYEAFGSVGHTYADRDLRESAYALLSHGAPVFFNIGFIGDAVSALESTALIRMQRRASPLLRAVAAPSQRVVDAGWRLPLAALGNQGDNGPTTTPLNAGQVDALSRLHHNLEAITGPPGTGKSTIISALVTQCVPANDRTLVAAVQNRAVESIVQKLAQTAEDVPFIVHGNAKRLSPASKLWTKKRWWSCTNRRNIYICYG